MMIDMWEQVRMNRRRTAVLLAMVAGVLMALGYVIGEAIAPGAGLIGVLGAMLVWLVMLLTAYFRGDSILMAVSGAREIKKEQNPRLFNVVEEMQIAAGLPKMPRVFIIDDTALNAFATGRKPDKAAIAVTAGLLGKLNRDQLQGVVAHEMAHVVNRDVLLMTIAGVTIGSIVMISELFLRGLVYGGRGAHSRRYRASGRGRGGGGGLMVVAAIVLAILAPLFAQFIYFAISRRREYLADASAAVLTRYPEGLAGALHVISRDGTPMARANKATAPMYISNPFENTGAMGLNLTGTHPPLNDRIRVLRGMGGNVSFAGYNEVLKKVKGARKGVIPQSALQADQPAPVRAAHPDDAPDPRARMREAGDLVRHMNHFSFIQCECGIRLKLPPDYAHPQAVCPRCKRSHEASQAEPAPRIKTATPRRSATK